LNTLISEHMSSVFLNTDHFAETMTRYAGGVEAQSSTITGMVTWEKVAQDDTRGRATMVRGEVIVSADTEISISDALVINDAVYSIDGVSPAQDGAMLVSVLRRLPETKGARPLRGQL
jgi:hypothetical protein